MENSLSLVSGKKKNIALIAHDNKKRELTRWCEKNRELLKEHNLFGTGTTSALIKQATGLNVTAFKSGPLGGDLQIGAQISEGNIDFMVFFWDPLTAQPHDPDVRALLRISTLYNIPTATNSLTADFLFTSSLLGEEYNREITLYGKELRDKIENVVEDVLEDKS